MKTRTEPAAGAAAATLAMLLSAGAAAAQESPRPLFVRASLSTAGPYGESWQLMLTPEGEAHLQVFYSSNPSGNLLGRFSLGQEQVSAIRKALDAKDFFGLASELAPSQRAFHRPHLQLEVHLGERHHKVSLYDPAALKERPTTERFLAVWQQAFQKLPFKPSW